MYGRASVTIELGDKDLVFKLVTGQVKTLKGLGEFLAPRINAEVSKLAGADESKVELSRLGADLEAAHGEIASLEGQLAAALEGLSKAREKAAAPRPQPAPKPQPEPKPRRQSKAPKE